MPVKDLYLKTLCYENKSNFLEISVWLSYFCIFCALTKILDYSNDDRTMSNAKL